MESGKKKLAVVALIYRWVTEARGGPETCQMSPRELGPAMASLPQARVPETTQQY